MIYYATSIINLSTVEPPDYLVDLLEHSILYLLDDFGVLLKHEPILCTTEGVSKSPIIAPAVMQQ